MKIGILAYRQAPFISANTAIAYTVGKELAAKAEIIYIGYKQEEKQDNIKEYDGIPVRFFNPTVPKKNRLVPYLARIFGERWRLRNEIKGLRKIVKEEKLDALIGVIAPADDALIIHYASLDIPVYLYQLDPFYNVGDSENEKLKGRFLSILREVKHLFTTDLLYEIYRKDPQILPYFEKISVVEFPKLRFSEQPEKSAEEREAIRLLYAGTLYKGIRSPDLLISLKKNLPEECQVIFCGGCDDPTAEKRLTEAGIVCKGYCSQEILKEENEKADGLINIGNLVKNQLGSKIVDYIATGKPILNIIQFDSCPTVSVLEPYRYKLHLSVGEMETKEASGKIKTFLQETREKKIPWEEIHRIYEKYTPEYVAKQIFSVIGGIE